MYPSRWFIVLFCLALLPGCRRDRDPDPQTSPPPPPVTVRGDASQAPQRLDNLVDDVISAQTPAEEAERMRQLREYMVDEDLTYRTRITRPTDTRAIDRGASTLTGPLRVEVDISRGRQVLRTFTFTPRDNRNLTALGQ
jgi:hypothetical protein